MYEYINEQTIGTKTTRKIGKGLQVRPFSV